MVFCDEGVCAFGWLSLAYFIYRIFIVLYKIIYPYFIAKPLNLLEKAGANWAVVTGSTDGIGRAYASELAERGFKILLISRTQSRLDEVKTEIESKFKVEVKTLAFDFTVGNVEAYEKDIVPVLQSMPIGILVNNVGRSYEYPDVLHKVDGGLKRLTDMNIINMLPVTLLCAAVLPQMVDRNSGIIVNIASAAAYNQMQMWAAYCAAKKYVIRLTNVMRREYSKTDLIIQCLCPMVVSTKMSKVRRPSFYIPSPEQFAKSAVRTIGIAPETTGYFSHQIQVEAMRLSPRFMTYMAVDRRTRSLNRKALLKKEEKRKQEQ
uniref:Steroid dehydrogenase let-767 n=1 Tax=Ascaris suum TaxID=6253 RepID=F1KX08_ASCSU